MASVQGKHCPKCERGSLNQGPKYVFSVYGNDRIEQLMFYCSICGYGEGDPCKDAPKEDTKAA